MVIPSPFIVLNYIRAKMRIFIKYIYLLAWLIQSDKGYSQLSFVDKNVVSGSISNPYFQCFLFYDSNATYRITQLSDSLFSPSVQPHAKINTPFVSKAIQVKGIWLYSEWENLTDKDQQYYFYLGTFPHTSVFLFNESTNKLEYQYLKDSVKNNNSFIFPITFKSQSSYKLWFYVSGHYKPISKLLFFIANESRAKTEETVFKLLHGGVDSYWFYRLPLYILLGVLLCMMLFSAANFTLNRSSVFLYYFCYLLFTFLYFFIRYHDGFNTTYHFFRLEPYRDITWQALSYLFYFLFAIHFVDYKRLSPVVYKLVMSVIILIILYIVIDLWLYWNYLYEIRNKSYNIFRIVMSPIAIFIIIRALTVKDTLSKILAAGSLFMVVGATITMILALFCYPSANPWLHFHMLYMQAGIVFEVLCFSTGLSYMVKLREQEKAQIENQLQKERETREIERLQTRIETQESERKRVASELHDDLGAGLSTIRLLSELALQNRENQKEIKRISELSNDLVDSMRQIIWSMNPESSSLTDFVHYVKLYASEVLEINGTTFNFKVKHDIPDYTLNPEQRRNLFLIIKESLHNSIKHARAKETVLIYEKTENGHRLSIRDNGMGFSEQDIQTKKGNGLSNLQKRAIKINSRVNIQSEPGKGTVVIIDFI